MAGTEVTLVDHRLAALEDAAVAYVDDQRPANTKRAYAADWRAWEEYCGMLGIPDTSDTPGALVGFVAYLERQGLAPSTIDRRLAGAVVGLRAHGAEPTKAATHAARAALNGYRRRLAEAGEKPGRGQAPALTVKDVRRICTACPDTIAGTRDRALVLVAFGIAGRRSEVASLLVGDITEKPEGLEIKVRFGKSGGRTVAVPYGSSPATCPVRAWLAWLAWLAASGISDGPAFRRINRHGHILGGMSGAAVGDVINRAADRAGLTVRYTGHSVRAGLATEARRAGHDAKTIAVQGGWSPTSAVLHGYMRVVDQWADNAVAGIGL